MFSPWTLIFGALTTFFMCLCTFILQPDVHTSFERLLGSSSLAIVHQFMAYLKEQVPIAALTIGKDGQIMRLSRDLVQCLDRLLKSSLMPFESGKFPAQIAASLGGLKRLRELRGW